MASKVYWADFRADFRENLQQKLTRLMKTAGMGEIDFDNKYVAIKMHFGEPGNLAFLRPNWAKTVADFVKERGGKPFLTDCNTLYVGGRKNGLDHLDTAMLNGFNPMTTGCQVIIADGIKGNDEVEVPVEGGEYVKNAKIGRAVMDADVFISLTHFKGHESAGFGGTLKNIGMGCGSRAGKMEQHNAGKPHVVQKHCVGISPKHKPVSFIFVGSTGVGKTELVKQLADDLFHAPESLIRLDMSEFMEKHSVSRIVGSPPGYVGYDEAGQLTEKIRRKPYSVVLFDEIEKAHPDVLNVLLQILDDGQITDAHGRKVNFENTVIVMTSNAGSDKSAGGTVGFGRSSDEQDKERVMKALQSFLRPEFINRVDEIVYFHQLTKENFAGIARIMLRELTDSLSAKGFTFTYDDTLVAYLVDKSYSAAYGARNLRRCIQKELEDPMAVRIIESFDHPITHIRASASGEKVTLETL